MGLLQKPTNPGLDAAACIDESCSKYEHGLFTSNAGKLSPSYDTHASVRPADRHPARIEEQFPFPRSTLFRNLPDVADAAKMSSGPCSMAL